MAVPTITTTSPSTGPSMGGNLVEIVGTNFGLPAAPPVTGVAPEAGPPVEVTFGGVVSSKVFAVATTRLFALAPKRSLLAASGLPIVSDLVDVVLTNLDSAGDPISGETVTDSNAYTYARVDVSGDNEGNLARIIRTLLQLFKSEVLPEVVYSPHTDYDDDSTQAPAFASAPAIGVIGPRLIKNDTLRQEGGTDDVPLGPAFEFFSQRRYEVNDLHFDVIAYSDNSVEFINIMQVLSEWIDRNDTISMPVDVGDPGAGTLTYELEYVPGSRFASEEQAGSAANSNLNVCRAEIRIVGFASTGLPGVARDRAVDISADVGDDGATVEQTDFPGGTLFVDQVQSRRGPPPGGGT